MEVSFAGAFFVEVSFAGAFFVEVSFAEAFFAGVFFAGAFPAGAFSVGAFSACASRPHQRNRTTTVRRTTSATQSLRTVMMTVTRTATTPTGRTASCPPRPAGPPSGR